MHKLCFVFALGRQKKIWMWKVLESTKPFISLRPVYSHQVISKSRLVTPMPSLLCVYILWHLEVYIDFGKRVFYLTNPNFNTTLESILPNFFLCKMKIFFHFLLLRLAILMYRQYFPVLQKHSSLTTKIWKMKKSKFYRIDSWTSLIKTQITMQTKQHFGRFTTYLHW